MILQYCGRCIIFFTNKFNIIFSSFILVPLVIELGQQFIIIYFINNNITICNNYHLTLL